MSGQNEQWDWRVSGSLVKSDIKSENGDFTIYKVRNAADGWILTLRDEGRLFALLYIVKWTEKKHVSYWDIILNKKSIIIRNFARLI